MIEVIEFDIVDEVRNTFVDVGRGTARHTDDAVSLI